MLFVFAALILPWMTRNYLCGATFDIDTNTGAMRHQNGAMLLAKINGTDFESEKRRLLAAETEYFATRENASVREREQWRKKEFRELVMKYPVTYVFQHLDPMIMLPDAPALLENFGITTSDRGTMGILKKNGLFQAVRHYFGENYLQISIFLLPLLLPTFLLYILLICGLAKDAMNIRSQWYELLIFLAFAEYYLFLPGSITAPRYQLPALPCICTLAACTAIKFMQRKNENKSAVVPSTEV